MNVNWTRIKESLVNLSEESGASLDYARGAVVATAAFMIGLGLDWHATWQQLVPLLPDNLRVNALPPAWFNVDSNEWNIPFNDVVKFKTLLDEIPEDMRQKRPEGAGTWTCRDSMLDKYIYICSIFQREKNREWAIYHDSANKDLAKPLLVCSFNRFRQAGSQYIAEWAISDHRKQQKETYNWHGQNTSRWLYAGCLLVQNGRVSIHT